MTAAPERAEREAGAPGAGAPSMRLDKWLFHARFFKTRALAARTVQEGRVRVDGEATTKPHRGVRAGDVLTFAQGRQVRVVRVTGLPARRGPAPEAQEHYDDLTPPAPPRPAHVPEAPRPEGPRPTGRDRRRMDRLKGPGDA